MAAKEEKKRLVVATGNVNKLREIAEIFPHYEVILRKTGGLRGRSGGNGRNVCGKLQAESRSGGEGSGVYRFGGRQWLVRGRRSEERPAFTARAMRADTETIGQTACCF